MKICMITTSYPRWKGDPSSIFVEHLCKEIVKQGIDISVVAPHDVSTEDYEIVSGVKIFRFRYWLTKKGQQVAYDSGIPNNISHSFRAKIQLPFFFFFFFLKIISVGRKCDSIYANWAFSGIVGSIAAKIFSVPFVIILRGSDIHLGMNNWFFKKILKKVFKQADHIFTVSNDLKKKIVLSIPSLDIKKITLLPNGVDTSIFKPRDKVMVRKKLGINKEETIILYVGRLIEGKGLDYLINGLYKILKKNDEVKLYLIGEGIYKEKLEQIIRSFSLQKKILFHGWKNHTELPYWYSAADIFILPSLSEGRSNVLLEALSTGLPVITTNIHGTSELIIDKYNGLLISSRSSNEIEDMVKNILNDKDLEIMLRSNSRASIFKKGLSWENSAKTIFDYIKNNT